MKTPKFTDAAKYPRGYVPASATNIAETFARVRREQAKNEAERKQKVAALRKAQA